MDVQVLAAFLGEANKATYANRHMPKAAPTRLKSLDYHFEKDRLAYHDTYFGVRDFIGAEIVYQDQCRRGAPTISASLSTTR